MTRIKELRVAANLQQSDIARILNVQRSTISHYETGKRQLDPATICALCDLFGCTADYLLCRSDTPLPALSDEDAAFLAAYHAAPENVRAAIDTLLRPVSELPAKKEAV